MKTVLCVVSMMIMLCGQAVGQMSSADSSFILMIVPGSDTVDTSTPVYRLSGSTNPGNSLMLNGKSLKVFPSGAFGGLLELAVGENMFTLVSRSPWGTESTKSFLVRRAAPLSTTPDDTLRIEDVAMMPIFDLWLNAGDLLPVQIKGTPGCAASFRNGIPMTELPPEEAHGLRGIYRGVYKVEPTDTGTNLPVEFRLQRASGEMVTRTSTARVSFKAREFPLVGLVKGDRPSLYFGLGEDRLGGAILSFISPGVRLTIDGKVGPRYRVTLAEGQEAWIDEWFVDLLPRGTFPPLSLSGSWNVYGDGKLDYVSVGFTDRLPYASFQESDPARIHVDVFGAASNSNWITQQLSTKEVTNVYYTQVGKNHLRLTIELKHKQVWGYEIGYQGTNLVIKVRRQPEKLKIKKLTFALDAGHGGENDGAVGSTGVKEKVINLATVYHLKELLEDKGAGVILTRGADSSVSMRGRLKTVFESGADILISVHSNSIGVTSNPLDVKGMSTYYKHICYRPLSVVIGQNLLKSGLAQFGNVGSFNFSLNSPTELPNVLVELAFMSHPEDEMKLLDDEFRRELARRILDGIEEFLEGCED